MKAHVIAASDNVASEVFVHSDLHTKKAVISLFNESHEEATPVHRPRMILLVASIISTTLFVCPAFAAPGDVSLATPNVACPQAQVGDAQLQSKYDEVWNLYATMINREAKSVEDEIARLYDEAKASGNLDLVLFWEGLKKSFADAGTVVWQPTTQKKDWAKRFQGAEFPSDFTAVLRKCEEGYGDAKNELENGYRLLIAELTKQGKVAEAQAVKSELASLWTREAEAQPKPVLPEQAAERRPTPQKSERQKALVKMIVGKWRRDGDPTDFFILESGVIEHRRTSGDLANRGRWRALPDGSGEAELESGHRWVFRAVGDDWIAVRETHTGRFTNDGMVLVRIK